ncbi:MFS transporter [Nonomuraea wenchangensis]
MPPAGCARCTPCVECSRTLTLKGDKFSLRTILAIRRHRQRSAALSLLVALLIWLLVPATPAHGRGRLDAGGALGLGAGLVCLLLGVSKGAEWGWTSGTTLGLLGAAVVVLLLWGLWELRVRDPLVDLRTTARPQVLLTNLASVLVGFAMYAQSLVVMQILQLPEATGHGLGQSMLAAGLWLAPSGLMMMAVSRLGARLSAARGPRTSLFAGALVIAVGYGSAFALMGAPWGLMVAGSIGSMGVGLAYGAMPALIMGAVPQRETASANGFNTLMRSIGTSVSAAVVGVVLSQMTVTVGGHVLPSESGFRTALLVGCGVALVAALVTLALPRRATEPPPAALAPAAPEPTATAAVPVRIGHEELIRLRAENAELRRELDVLMRGVSSWVQNLAGRTDRQATEG